MTPHIKITYSPGGAAKVEPLGFKGGTCHAASSVYEAGHGIRQIDKEPTEEAFQIPVKLEQQQQQGV